MLSIVIPTLNEAESLPRILTHTKAAAQGADIELIVSDCGSDDGTPDLARSLGTICVPGGICRATALNAGAACSHGDTLLFLHADTRLPAGFPSMIGRALRHDEIIGGAFDFKFASHPLSRGLTKQGVRVVQILNRIRFRWTGNFYGDQSIFVRRSTFDQIGGFEPVRLMEDVRFSRRMKRFGRTAILCPPVKTSPRRFVTHGVIRQFRQDLVLLACESLGMNPEALWARYNRWNNEQAPGEVTVLDSTPSRSP